MKDVCSVGPEEMKVARKWGSTHLGKLPPFSFIYDGRFSGDFLKNWTFEQSSRALDDRRTERALNYTDPASGLNVRVVAVEYQDFPVVEWTIYFKNEGSSDTPIIENIRALDLKVTRRDLVKGSEASPSSANPLLHYNIGSPTRSDDYRPLVAELTPNSVKRVATSGGRPCNDHMPFFNLEWAGCGLIIAVGWPGQWAAEFSRKGSDEVRVCAGQEVTHFRLHPGEEVRSPLIAVQFYEGDWIRGQNIWRRWIIADNMPRPAGKLPSPQIAASTWLYFAPWGISNALAMKVFIDTYEARKIPIDAWWIDAGWYACNFPETGGKAEEETSSPPPTGTAPGDPSWPNVGTWEPDPHRFPRGIREVSDHAHSKGLRTIVWFEPERVMPGTWLAENHPEWLLWLPDATGDKKGEEKARLLNLSNPDALDWLINHIDKLITREGIDVYREDFNMDPLHFWRANEPEDRRGILEINYVTNHLAFWDELLRRHPGLLIDNCSSGCKRADLETMRRSVVFWRSDYTGDFVLEGGKSRVDANQCITYGIALWIPYFGAGSTVIDPYRFHSHMSPSFVIDLDPRRGDLNIELLRRLIGQFKQVANYYFGDYYPLTDYSLENDVWMAWQFDCPEIGEGMVQVFRREKSPQEGGSFKLRGLQSDAFYTVTNLETGESRRLPGRTLMEEGLSVKIPNAPGSAIIAYRRERK